MNTTDRLSPIKDLLLTIICQFVGITFSSGLAQFGLSFLLPFAIHSIISGYLSIFFRLSVPWRFLNFMIPAGILVSVAFPGYGWVWFILLLVFGLIFLPTFWTRVPYFPSAEKVYELIAKELPVDQAFNFIDLGCGDGKLLKYLALKFPKAQFAGYDLSPTAILAAKAASIKSNNLSIHFGDYWKVDLSNYNCIYSFLSPTPMAKLEEKIKRECKKDSLILINSFRLPGLKPSKTVDIQEKNQTSLYVYRI